MENELLCPVCHCLFKDPVILPCFHNVCCKCASALILKNKSKSIDDLPSQFCSNKDQADAPPQNDRVSVNSAMTLVSDADSGYSANSGSGKTDEKVRGDSSGSDANRKYRSLVRISKFGPIDSMKNKANTLVSVNMPSLPKSINCLSCPVCFKTMFLDDRGEDGLPKHKIIEKIIKKFENSFHRRITKDPGGAIDSEIPTFQYQSCSKSEKDIEIMEYSQMKASCCNRYQDLSQTHCEFLNTKSNTGEVNDQVTNVREGAKNVQSYGAGIESPSLNDSSLTREIELLNCKDHPTEKNSLYCETCNLPLCVFCREGQKHTSHVMWPIGSRYKEQKAELSRKMNALSVKARRAQELALKLQKLENKAEQRANALVAETRLRCNSIVEAVESKREEMIKEINKEKHSELKALHEQLQQCTSKLKQTTGLLEYSVEVTKENDAAAFLMVCDSLCSRVREEGHKWDSTNFRPQQTAAFSKPFEVSSIIDSVNKLQLSKSNLAPSKPAIYVDKKGLKCNSASLTWIASSQSPPADGYKLKIDNGCGGPYREVYSGCENTCTVEGLHSNRVYRVRVRAFNDHGFSSDSDTLFLQSSPSANASRFNPRHGHPDVELSADCQIATSHSSSIDERVLLSEVGFSRGIHCWEYLIDRCDASSIPSFGIALPQADRSKTLGSDGCGWCIRVGQKESCLYHNSRLINRLDARLKPGLGIKVLLDLINNSVSFYANGEKKGSLPIEMPTTNSAVLYSAISFSGNTQITMLSDTSQNSKRLQSGSNDAGEHLKRSLSLNCKQSTPDPQSLRRWATRTTTNATDLKKTSRSFVRFFKRN